jgi:hypothetical protein
MSGQDGRGGITHFERSLPGPDAAGDDGGNICARAVNMGEGINSAGHEMCPSVSPDGKYIFFGRGILGKKTDIY